MRKRSIVISIALIVSLLLCGVATAECLVQELGDLYTAYTFRLDGVQYQLPAQVKDFVANGWQLMSYDGNVESEMLEGKTYTIHNWIENDTAKIGVYTLNPTDDPLPMSDCYVVLLRIDSTSYEEKVVAATGLFSLPNGLAIGSTVLDFMNASGLTLSHISDETNLVSYWDGNESQYFPGYYFLKDGMFYCYVGREDQPWENISFNYKLADDNRAPALRNNVSLFGDNNFTYYFDGSVTDENSKIVRIDMELMMPPLTEQKAEEAPASTSDSDEDGSWTCENGHSGNTGNFCTECGSPKPVAKAACASCGYEFEGETPKFCPNCGAAQ